MNTFAATSGLVLAPFCLGIVLFVISLFPLVEILRVLQAGSLRRCWLTLAGCIGFFIAGYAYIFWAELDRLHTTLDFVVAVVALLGACFVAGVTFLSRRTMMELIATGALAREAFVDSLTGLHNRRYLSTSLADEIGKAKKSQLSLSLLMIDLDHFKRVNDLYGHQTGDDVLRRVGQMLVATARPPDIVVRYGGEEILLVAPHTDMTEAASFAESLRSSVQAAVFQTASDAALSVSCSIGVTSLLSTDTAKSLIERADKALYRAKLEGRNRVCVS